jgi:hypothetical protein
MKVLMKSLPVARWREIRGIEEKEMTDHAGTPLALVRGETMTTPEPMSQDMSEMVGRWQDNGATPQHDLGTIAGGLAYMLWSLSDGSVARFTFPAQQGMPAATVTIAFDKSPSTLPPHGRKASPRYLKCH